MQLDFDVVIIGGGMVGLSLAVSLGKQNIPTLLVEGSNLKPDSIAGESGYEPRVSAITDSSRQWLYNLDAWQLIDQQKVCNYVSMDVWDAEGTGEVNFNAQDTGQPSLGCIIENNVIQTALLDVLEKTNVKVISNSKLSSIKQNEEAGIQYQTVTLDDGYSVTCQLLVGADGEQSKVRQLADFESYHWEYEHNAIVTTITTELPHQYCARQSFAPDGPLGILPLAGENNCSIVWSLKPVAAKQLMDVNDDEFCQQIGRAMESRLGKVIAVDKRYCIPLVPNLTKSYVKTGVALVGDAAHRIHPLAGQGVNLGFMDAAELSDNIQQSLIDQQSMGSLYQLRKYQRNRQGHNMAMTAAMETFKRLFETENLAIRWARNFGMKQFNQLSFIKNEVIQVAMGLKGPLPNGMK